MYRERVTRWQAPTRQLQTHMKTTHFSRMRSFPALALAGAAGVTFAEGPSFPCDRVEAGSIEELVCRDSALSGLDRSLAETYAAAQAKAVNEHPPVLKTEQTGWIKGRNDCWKSDDVVGCVRAEYERRIAELQARYRLVDATGPFGFMCNGEPANEVIVTYFATQPPSLIAERGDSVSLMFLQPDDTGESYRGRNESLRLSGDEALVIWGYQMPEMRCRQSR